MSGQASQAGQYEELPIEQTAETLCVSKVEVLRRMFTILKITQEEKKKGNDLGIVNGDTVVARFIGV